MRRNLFLSFLLVLITSIAMGQAQKENGFERDDHYVTAHNEKKDTLFIRNNHEGMVFKRAWEKTDIPDGQKPVIMMVSLEKLKRIANKRNFVLRPKNQ